MAYKQCPSLSNNSKIPTTHNLLFVAIKTSIITKRQKGKYGKTGSDGSWCSPLEVFGHCASDNRGEIVMEYWTKIICFSSEEFVAWKKNILRKYCKTGLDGSRTLGEAPSSLDVEGLWWNIQQELANWITLVPSRRRKKWPYTAHRAVVRSVSSY